MTPTRSALFALASLLIAGCAFDSALSESRKALHEGRAEEALQILERTIKESPQDRAARNEYFRVRDLLSSQWLGQAETLRSTGELEAAEALYRRVQRYDAQNARARLGL